MRALPLLLVVLHASSFLAADARASGSVTVTVLAKRHTLTVAQTFRKILAADHASDYYDSVRKSFLAVAARLTPRIDALLERRAAELPGLGVVDLGLPTVIATKPGRFPALVRLAAVEAGGGRLAFDVRIPLRRRPDATRVAELRRAIAALIRAHGEPKEEGAGVGHAAVLPPVREQRGQLLLEVQSHAYATAAQARRLSAQLRALATKVRGRLEARLKSESNVTLAPYDAQLKYYEDSKQLPGIVAERHGSGDLHLQLSFVVKELANAEALATLRQDLRRLLEAAAPD